MGDCNEKFCGDGSFLYFCGKLVNMAFKPTKIYAAALALMLAANAVAAPIDEAKRLYREGDYAAAVEKLRTLVRRSPRDGNVNYYLGASLYAMGDNAEAVAPLKVAAGRGVADAHRMLAEIALSDYRADDASESLDAWSAALKKARKSVPDSHAELSRRALTMRNMLERVESIEVLDSLTVDSADFFTHYRLSSAAGRVLPPEAVRRAGAGSLDSELSAAYMPQNRSELLWAASDTAGVFALYGADILDDGTLDHTKALGDNLSEGGSALYPFLMPDGVTLYFANNGENSLGGYDIFMTRRNDAAEEGDDAFFVPQNVGMPYNSPYNDYLLAIDETSGLGWWATDRNQIPGKVTIYVFVPSAVRVNVPAGDENLRQLARLSDISLTRREYADGAAELTRRLPAADETADAANAPRRFALDMGNGTVYTSLNQFKNQGARSAMLEALAAEMALNKQLAALDELRERYRRGERTTAGAILEAEEQLPRLRRAVAEARNKAVRLEAARR